MLVVVRTWESQLRLAGPVGTLLGTWCFLWPTEDSRPIRARAPLISGTKGEQGTPQEEDEPAPHYSQSSPAGFWNTVLLQAPPEKQAHVWDLAHPTENDSGTHAPGWCRLVWPATRGSGSLGRVEPPRASSFVLPTTTVVAGAGRCRRTLPRPLPSGIPPATAGRRPRGLVMTTKALVDAPSHATAGLLLASTAPGYLASLLSAPEMMKPPTHPSDMLPKRSRGPEVKSLRARAAADSPHALRAALELCLNNKNFNPPPPRGWVVTALHRTACCGCCHGRRRRGTASPRHGVRQSASPTTLPPEPMELGVGVDAAQWRHRCNGEQRRAWVAIAGELDATPRPGRLGPWTSTSAARGGQRHPWKFPRPAQGLPDAMAVIFPLSLIPRRKRLFYDRLPPGSRDAIARHPQPPIPESTGEIWGFSIAGIASSSWQSAVVLVGRVALVVAAMRESQRRPGGARGHRKRTESKRHSSIVNADPTSPSSLTEPHAMFSTNLTTQSWMSSCCLDLPPPPSVFPPFVSPAVGTEDPGASDGDDPGSFQILWRSCFRDARHKDPSLLITLSNSRQLTLSQLGCPASYPRLSNPRASVAAVPRTDAKHLPSHSPVGPVSSGVKRLPRYGHAEECDLAFGEWHGPRHEHVNKPSRGPGFSQPSAEIRTSPPIQHGLHPAAKRARACGSPRCQVRSPAARSTLGSTSNGAEDAPSHPVMLPLRYNLLHASLRARAEHLDTCKAIVILRDMRARDRRGASFQGQNKRL
ncbi:hypothetical protein JHW43_005493 [Diplocarpon mali]|nr:hypothetical protein JHW43_005493 [Diplocarpon mali]